MTGIYISSVPLEEAGVWGVFVGGFEYAYFLHLIFFFLPSHAECRILVPRPGIKPAPFTVEAGSLNHWTTREVPRRSFDLLSIST